MWNQRLNTYNRDIIQLDIIIRTERKWRAHNDTATRAHRRGNGNVHQQVKLNVSPLLVAIGYGVDSVAYTDKRCIHNIDSVAYIDQLCIHAIDSVASLTTAFPWYLSNCTYTYSGANPTWGQIEYFTASNVPTINKNRAILF